MRHGAGGALMEGAAGGALMEGAAGGRPHGTAGRSTAGATRRQDRPGEARAVEARAGEARSRGLAAAVAVALSLAVAGCAQLPEAPASPGLREAPADTLRLASWPAKGRTRAAILALHGFGDAGELTYGGPAAYWAARGIAVHAPDQRGFGANPSRRDWPGVGTLVADAKHLAAEVRARHPGVPLVVVGHSMGGGVALAAAAEGMDADALVLAGPAIAGGDQLSPVLRAGAWALAAALPDRRWTGRNLKLRPSDNVEAMARVASDPRHFADPSSRELWGLVRVMDAAAAAAPEVGIPVLTLMGARDMYLRPERVRAVHERAPGAVGFRRYPEGWHWLFRDLRREAVWRDVADFALAIGQVGSPKRPETRALRASASGSASAPST